MTLNNFGGQLQEPIVEDRPLVARHLLWTHFRSHLGEPIVEDRPLVAYQVWDDFESLWRSASGANCRGQASSSHAFTLDHFRSHLGEPIVEDRPLVTYQVWDDFEPLWRSASGANCRGQASSSQAFPQCFVKSLEENHA